MLDALSLIPRLPALFLPFRLGRRGHLAVVLAAALSVSGCALTKRDAYPVPEVAVPANYKHAPSGEPAPAKSLAEGAATLPREVRDIGLVEWWRSFGNPELNGLIDQALANNADLRIATLRLAQAQLRSEQASAGRLPTLTAPGLMAIQTPGGSSAGGVPISGGGAGSAPPIKSYQGSLRGEWRLDVWGEQAALAESAALQTWRAAFERDNVQRGIVASVASSYIEYVSLNDRLRVAKETESVLAASLTAIQKRTEAGDATLTDMEQQRAAIFAVRATVPMLEQQREEALNALAFQLGTVPGALRLSDAGMDSFQLPKVLTGLPSTLILRRPDVRMVEARMLAADADIDVARARILPSIDLSSQVGYSSLYLSSLFSPQTLFWNALASFSASIFDGGRRRAERDISQSIHEEMVETYIRTIYQAIREVETSLATIQLAGKRLDAQQEAVRSARKAWQISGQVYASGAVDYLTLLDTERTYHRHLDEYQRIRMDYVRAYIGLFNALGGGVKQGANLPGEGRRPSASGATAQVLSAEGLPVLDEGVRWHDEPSAAEEYWMVELPGLHHRSTVGAVWRDLRARYPQWMNGRVVKPVLVGKIEDGADAREAWFRLQVSRFATQVAAEEFCQALQTGQQRCRIVSSRHNEPVKPSARAALKASAPVAAPSIAPLPPASPAVAAAPEPAPPVQPPAMPASALSTVDASPVTKTDTPTPQGAPAAAGPPAVVAEPAAAALPAPTLSAADTPSRPGNAPAVPERVMPDPAGAASPAPAAPAAPVSALKSGYAVQLGAFSTPDIADKAVAEWQGLGVALRVSPLIMASGRVLYAVRTETVATRQAAQAQARALTAQARLPASVVAVRDGAGVTQ